MSDQIAAIILGAGKGTRMKSDLPKVMMPLAGKPMIRHPIDTLEQMGVKKIVVVTAPDGEMVRREVAPHLSCIQEKQLGTGHAVLSAKEQMKGFDGAVLVIFGDNPIITKETYQMAVDKVKEGYAVVVLGFRPADAARYGRLVMETANSKRLSSSKTLPTRKRPSTSAIRAACALTAKPCLNFWRRLVMKMPPASIILPMRLPLPVKKG